METITEPTAIEELPPVQTTPVIVTQTAPLEPVQIGDTLYPPEILDDTPALLEAVDKELTEPLRKDPIQEVIGIKYRPFNKRIKILQNAMVDCFIGHDNNPAKLVEFVDQLKVRRPELAVAVLNRILDDHQRDQDRKDKRQIARTAANNPQNQNRAAPIVIQMNQNSPIANEVFSQDTEPEITEQKDYAPLVIPEQT
jgi:hypothetical protein